jgi:acetyl-CoA carboxylase beta subunit
MIGVQPFDFLGGSLGMGVGEALIESMQAAIKEKRPISCSWPRVGRACRKAFSP